MHRHLQFAFAWGIVFGSAFAVGWSPCVGAVLGSVLALAATSPGSSFGLLMVYSLGLGLPFLLMGLFTNKALELIRRFKVFFKYFNYVVGVFLIVLGVLVFTQNLHLVASVDGLMSLIN